MSERPDKQQRKELLHSIRAKQRAEARAKLPMSDELMQALFDSLDAQLGRAGCDHSLRCVEAWAAENQVDVSKLLEWCRDHGGYCDCEVLANCEQQWEDAIHDVDW